MWSGGEMLWGLVISCAATVLTVIIMRRRRGSMFPPGPPAWPLIGHLHLFSHPRLAALSQKYGHLLGLRLGQLRVVVVSSPQLAKEVLTTHDKIFSQRLPFAFTSLMFFGPSNGIIFNSGPRWRKHRKICMLQLFTAKRLHDLQYVRLQEIHTLLLSLHHHSHAGTSAIDLGHHVGHMSSRILMRLLHSRASTHIGNENLYSFIRDQELEMVPTLGDFIPSLSCLDFFSKRRFRRFHARLDKVYTEILLEHRQSTSPNDDLLNALLSQEEPMTVLEIKTILHEMLGAGVHTTALTIEWAMAELLRHPDCLHKLQREIATQLGEKKQISDADLPRLSYLKCVIKEVSRLHPMLPLLIPRMSTEECKMQGYTIPAKTLLFVNVWAIGRDERVWQNANEFMPERFEGTDIDLRGQHFELLPFGSGRRSCMGLPLALSVVEVTLGNLVSCFDWELPKGETHKSINMDEKMGFTANKATPVIVIPKPRVSILELPNIDADYSRREQ